MDCIEEKNRAQCSCSDTRCERRGKCCLCINHHRKKNQLPACFFHAEYEKTFDRSLENFLRMVEETGMRTV